MSVHKDGGRVVSNNDLAKSLEVMRGAMLEEQAMLMKRPDRNRYVPIDLNSVSLKETGGLGAEVICMM